MGYHANVLKGLADLIVAAVPSTVPVLEALSVDETQLERFARGVFILRESIAYEPHPEIRPDTSVKDQGETWTWTLYVLGGGGEQRPADKGSEIDLLLETIQTALNAQRPTSDCGPMHLVLEDFESKNGNTVMYSQQWTHRRLA